MATDRQLTAGSGIQLWGTDQWRQEATGWLDQRLAEAGLTRTGEVEQPHLEAWATALRAPTTGGPVWLKAAGPGTAFEVGLYRLLHRLCPDRVLTPIALDTDRGWLVLPDGGQPLGVRYTGEELLAALVRAAPEYGQLQRDLIPHTGDLLELGIVDMGPAALPDRLVEALAVTGEYARSCGDPAQLAYHQRAAAAGPLLARWCEELAAAPVGLSLDHNDLHPCNILVHPGTDRPRFFDWGDAVVAHPFASGLVLLGYVHHSLGYGLTDPGLLRLRDAYLEPFGDLAPHAELVATLELACRVGKVARALVWHRAVRVMDSTEAEEHAGQPLRWLRSLPDESYLRAAG